MRHGKAEDPSFSIPDGERKLTPEGVSIMTAAAGCYRDLGVAIDLLFSSPLPRALETAKIIAKELGFPETFVRVEVALAGRLNIDAIRRMCLLQPDASGAMFVGHEPDLVEIVQQLCHIPHPFKKGEIVCIEAPQVARGAGRILWNKPPSQLIGRRPKDKAAEARGKP